MTLETILKETNPNKFIRDLDDFVSDPNIGGSTQLDKAPPLIKAIIYLNAFDNFALSTLTGVSFLIHLLADEI